MKPSLVLFTLSLRSIYRIAQFLCWRSIVVEVIGCESWKSGHIINNLYVFCSMIYALFFSYRFHLIFVYRPHDIVNSLLFLLSLSLEEVHTKNGIFPLHSVQRTREIHPYYHHMRTNLQYLSMLTVAWENHPKTQACASEHLAELLCMNAAVESYLCIVCAL